VLGLRHYRLFVYRYLPCTQSIRVRLEVQQQLLLTAAVMA
jgi:hypothetical protein